MAEALTHTVADAATVILISTYTSAAAAAAVNGSIS